MLTLPWIRPSLVALYLLLIGRMQGLPFKEPSSASWCDNGLRSPVHWPRYMHCSFNCIRPVGCVGSRSGRGKDGLVFVANCRPVLAQAIPAEACRPLPAFGKVGVLAVGSRADALMEVPSASTRESAPSLPAIMWLTVGILAENGFALQVRSQPLRAPKAVCMQTQQIGA